MFETPPFKKPKIDKENKVYLDKKYENYLNLIENITNFTAIMSDDYAASVETVKVFIGHVKDPKNISKSLILLNDRLPLKEFSHLKRARKSDLILAPTSFINGALSIYKYLEVNIVELKDVFEYFKEIDVPAKAPLTIAQCKEALKFWSCNFHPNKTIENLISNKVFTLIEICLHKSLIQLALDSLIFMVSKKCKSDCDLENAAVVFDPSINSVVAVACDNSKYHPMQHAVMLAIDKVAATQGGCVWCMDNQEDSLKGIDHDLRTYLSQKYPHILFQSREVKGNKIDDPYLCTGYYVYMVREPCLMCSMALVHARVKRIFYLVDNKCKGGLKSKTKLQTISSLNHHFEVFSAL